MVRRLLLLLIVLGLCVGGPLSLRADDVPDDARSHFDKARTLFAKGDLKKAFSAISKGKGKNPDSVDFWELYVRIWRALDKKEDTLWTKIIAKAEARLPGSTTFDMLRLRFEADPEKRVELLKGISAKKPDDVAPKLMLAREYLKQEEEDWAEEILDEVLEKDPGNEIALVTKGELMIESGLSRSAVSFAKETLAQHDLPGLHALAARALLIVAENDETVLEEALEHAQKAVAGSPEPENVLVLASILERTGKAEGAVAVLSEHYERTASPLLAGRLGELAFRTGDYAAAAKALVVAAPSDKSAALALALCEARCGRAKEARAAVKHLTNHGAEAMAWAGSIELILGDAKAARAHYAACQAEWAAKAPAICAGYEGKVDEVVSLVGEDASSGTRDGEEWLLEVAEARLYTKLGAKADAARKMLLESRWAAGKAKIEGATAPDFETSVAAVSHGFMQRYVSYRRSVDGNWFTPGQLTPIAPTQIDGEAALGPGCVGNSNCERDAQRLFPFNAKKLEGNITITMESHADVWEAASTAFTEGSAALVSGDMAKADEAFGKVLESEVSWGRARLFQAVAKVAAGTDLEAAATLAKEAIPLMIDDWEGRELAVLVLIAAGKDGKAEAKALNERMESFTTRRYAEFWEEEE